MAQINHKKFPQISELYHILFTPLVLFVKIKVLTAKLIDKKK